MAFNDHFGAQHQAFLIKGQDYRQLFLSAVNEFFDDQDHHLYIPGQPGVGKSYTVETIADKKNIKMVTLKGDMKPWAFIKTIAVAVYLAQPKEFVAVYIDDMNGLFTPSTGFLDMFKIAMDKNSGDRLEYNTSLGAQVSQAETLEQEAIEHWKSMYPDRTGFIVPFDGRVKFIFTMNTPLATAQDLNQYAIGSPKWVPLNNKHAIYSRVTYEDLIMDQETYWGWIADVVWNTNMCIGATEDQKAEMLHWLWDNWTQVKETSVRFVEDKLWRYMAKYANKRDYRARWEKQKCH
jgi:hypothetical protein